MLFVKITTLILLSWICHIYIYMNTYNKTLGECYNYRKKLYTRNYRLLEKYNQDKYPSSVCLMEDIPNGIHNKKDIYINQKYTSEKKKQSYRCSLSNEKGHKKDVKNKTYIFETKKYSNLEKKIFKELDYEEFLKKNRTISDRIYKKIIRKKCGLRFALPLLILLVFAISFILDNFCRCGLTFGLKKIIVLISPVSEKVSPALKSSYDLLTKSRFSWFTNSVVKLQNGKMANYCAAGFLGFLIYFVPIFLLSVILIAGVVYYHKKVKKYEKIRHRKR
ncbi:hypothetical protein MKS88_001760 [Plasmodium brasilianum]|uniref:Uncharacterized protein n=1 Tax=Plasmodium brasilianum TaxID=5824 RepID=A0ACB9YAP3_PLABR|nr:hypothetical protein MKS88_001760 [Plasmodium brasilianum]